MQTVQVKTLIEVIMKAIIMGLTEFLQSFRETTLINLMEIVLTMTVI